MPRGRRRHRGPLLRAAELVRRNLSKIRLRDGLDEDLFQFEAQYGLLQCASRKMAKVKRRDWQAAAQLMRRCNVAPLEQIANRTQRVEQWPQ